MVAYQVEVVTYNVLSSSLSGVGHFTKCTANALHPSNRLGRVLRKLRPALQRRAIVCLQEVNITALVFLCCSLIMFGQVSRPWDSEFLNFFESHDYCYVSSLYGSDFNGYMGVAVAFPRDEFSLCDSEISRLSDCLIKPSTSRLEPGIALLFFTSVLLSYFPFCVFFVIRNGRFRANCRSSYSTSPAFSRRPPFSSKNPRSPAVLHYRRAPAQT